jgi:hypothetical protein
LLFAEVTATSDVIHETGQVRLVEQCGGIGVEMQATASSTTIAYAHAMRVEIVNPPGLFFPELEAQPYVGSGVFASCSEIAGTKCRNVVKDALAYLQLHSARRPRWEHLLAMYVDFLVIYCMCLFFIARCE